MVSHVDKPVPKKEQDEEEYGAYDIRKIYWDAQGNLRHGKTLRNRDHEVFELIRKDTHDESDMEKLWMIVPSRWIREWLLFAYYKTANEPGPITMSTLLTADGNNWWRPLKTLRPPSTEPGKEHPGHYRRISFEAWFTLYELYKMDTDGHAIAVLGYPYDDLSRWRVFRNPRYIDVRTLPPPVLPKDNEINSTIDKKKNEGDVGKQILDGMSSTINSFFK